MKLSDVNVSAAALNTGVGFTGVAAAAVIAQVLRGRLVRETPAAVVGVGAVGVALLCLAAAVDYVRHRRAAKADKETE